MLKFFENFLFLGAIIAAGILLLKELVSEKIKRKSAEGREKEARRDADIAIEPNKRGSALLDSLSDND